MLNPALIATILAGAAESYEARSGETMPWEYSYILVPLVLHRDSREALPSRLNSHMTSWVVEHPVLIAGLPSRARELAPYIREGLRFGLRTESLKMERDGTLMGRLLSSPSTLNRSKELAVLVRSSGFVGRWLTVANRPSDVFALLGVSP